MTPCNIVHPAPGYDATQICDDCGTPEGQLHNHFPCCALEACPLCLYWQMISCDCIYQVNRLVNHHIWTKETGFLPPEVYANGPTEKHRSRWMRRIEKAGRIPFVFFPTFCARCGLYEPPMWMVTRRQWQRVMPRNHWHDYLCWECFQALCRCQRLRIPTPRWIH